MQSMGPMSSGSACVNEHARARRHRGNPLDGYFDGALPGAGPVVRRTINCGSRWM